VAAPIRVGKLDSAEAADLVDAFAVRGLIAKPVGDGPRLWIEIHEAHEDTERLVAEVTSAVEAWLADRGRDEVELRVSGRSYPVRAPSTLTEALHPRRPARTDQRRA
jgi:hypothetical protein